MGEFNVTQRTSDGYFNATELLSQWNKSNTDVQRRIDKFWDSTHLCELMSEIAENELNFKSPDFGELKSKLSVTKKGKYNSGTWMHPILFVKFAMYLSPKFEYHVLKFVSDELIAFRHKIGDNNNTTMKCLQPFGFDVDDYAYVNRAINYIVFDNHFTGIRNTATEEQMQQINDIQNKIQFSIEMKFVSNRKELISFMRKLYVQKWSPF